ncbi:hypothetical protein GWJ21_16450 [Bacillus coagulans]|uniref:hypothetical protein n=1 Tax=Heyndrickxia coagulans TaxID=1398 RepID=UPI0013772C63|nr:hypothetical protein [Heyndrickxia coagulans]NCG69384.1 hypothetical protein [Heyndrickxia coagulans]
MEPGRYCKCKKRAATNQYAADIGLSSKQVLNTYKLYNLLDSGETNWNPKISTAMIE